MHPRLTAQWASRIGTYRAKVGKETGLAVYDRLIRIRDRWAADVRVDTAHYRDTVQATEPEMSGTTGRIQPPIEGKKDDYFYYNEYGAPTISARPSMRQAIKAEQDDFWNTLDAILNRPF